MRGEGAGEFIGGPHTFEKSTTFAVLSILSKTKPVRTLSSIATDFPKMVVDEFDGWVEPDKWFLLHLCDVSLGLF